MQGKCLCGRVEFELSGVIPGLYQCHCSLCRKVSGSSANAALIIDASQFRWLRGEKGISSFVTETGFVSDFCANCGSPVPNSSRGGTAYWVPVGLLQDSDELSLVAHVHMGSKARWDIFAGDVAQFDAMPDADTWARLFDTHQ